VDRFVSSSSHLKVTTSDSQLQKRCQHHLPKSPRRVVKPLGPKRTASARTSLQLERSETLASSIAWTLENANVSSCEPFFVNHNKTSTTTTTRNVRKQQESSQERRKASATLHKNMRAWEKKNARDSSLFVGSAAAVYATWFQHEYRFGPASSSSSTTTTTQQEMEPQTQHVTFSFIVSWIWHILHGFMELLLLSLSSCFSITRNCRTNSKNPTLLHSSQQLNNDSNSTTASSSSSSSSSVMKLCFPPNYKYASPLSIDRRVQLDNNCCNNNNNTLTLCVVSDTHGFEHPLPNADVLLHCGDFCNDFRHDKAEQRLDAWLAKHNHPIKIVIRGNHDAPRRTGMKILPKSGAVLLGGGGNKLLHIQEHNNNDDDDDDDDDDINGGVRILAIPWNSKSSSFPNADVVVSHAPPHGILDLTKDGHHVGSKLLRKGLLSSSSSPPALWCFGHIHEGRGFRRCHALGTTTTTRTRTTTLCVNASNANDGRAAFWATKRPPLVIQLYHNNNNNDKNKNHGTTTTTTTITP